MQNESLNRPAVANLNFRKIQDGGRQNRQGNAAVPMRLPPISVPLVASNERRKQQTAAAGDATGRAGNDRGAGLYASPGRMYKCSAMACVTVLSQPPASTDQAHANDGDEQASGSADLPNRNRKYSRVFVIGDKTRRHSWSRRCRRPCASGCICQPEPEVRCQSSQWNFCTTGFGQCSKEQPEPEAL